MAVMTWTEGKSSLLTHLHSTDRMTRFERCLERLKKFIPSIEYKVVHKRKPKGRTETIEIAGTTSQPTWVIQRLLEIPRSTTNNGALHTEIELSRMKRGGLRKIRVFEIGIIDGGRLARGKMAYAEVDVVKLPPFPQNIKHAGNKLRRMWFWDGGVDEMSLIQSSRWITAPRAEVEVESWHHGNGVQQWERAI